MGGGLFFPRMKTHSRPMRGGAGGGAVVFALGLLFFSAAPAPAEDAWLRLDSEHFEMLSAAPEKHSRGLLVKLEQFRALFLDIMRLRRAFEPRITIVVFKNEQAFAPYLPAGRDGKPRESIDGYFVNVPGGAFIAMAGDSFTGTIFHEYVHSLIAPRCPWMPLWLNEGLATVFQTVRVTGDRLTFGEVNEDMVHFLRGRRLIPMRAFLAVDQSSSYYREDDHSGRFYAQAWAAAHYLVCGESGGGKALDLGKLINLLGDPAVPLDDALRQGTGLGIDALGARLHNYIIGGTYLRRSGVFPAAPFREKITARPAAADEVGFALLNLKWLVHRAADTEARMILFAEQHPANPRPHEALAVLRLIDRQEMLAADDLRRAAALGSDNAWVFIMLARHEIARLPRAPDYRLPEALNAELRAWLARAIALAPDCMDAYEMLAIVEAFSPKMRADAVRLAFENARDLPTISARARLMYASAVIFWRTKESAASLRLLNALLRLPDEPAVVARGGSRRGFDGVVRNSMEPIRADARKFRARVEAEIAAAGGGGGGGSNRK
jgi:hypothetical protein